MAKKFNIPDLIIGLTIVAFWTSTPESTISITAAIGGQNEMAINSNNENNYNIMVFSKKYFIEYIETFRYHNIIGGNLVVNSASNIAMFLGMSENLVGLIMVVLGTSLSELVTSIITAIKDKIDIV